MSYQKLMLSRSLIAVDNLLEMNTTVDPSFQVRLEVKRKLLSKPDA